MAIMTSSSGIHSHRFNEFLDELQHIGMVTGAIDSDGKIHLAVVFGRFTAWKHPVEDRTNIACQLHIDTLQVYTPGSTRVTVDEHDVLQVSSAERERLTDLVKHRANAAVRHSGVSTNKTIHLIVDTAKVGSHIDLGSLGRFLDCVRGAAQHFVARDGYRPESQYDTPYRFSVSTINITVDHLSSLCGLPPSNMTPYKLLVRSSGLASLSGAPDCVHSLTLSCKNLASFDGISSTIGDELNIELDITNGLRANDFSPLRKCSIGATRVTEMVGDRVFTLVLNTEASDADSSWRITQTEAHIRTIRNLSALITALAPGTRAHLIFNMRNPRNDHRSVIVPNHIRIADLLAGAINSRVGTGRAGILSLQRALADAGLGDLA